MCDDTLHITGHALAQARKQSLSAAKLTEEKLRKRILDYWTRGEPVKQDWAMKFEKYGLQALESESRRFQDWIITRCDNAIVTTHLKTSQEKSRDRNAAKAKRRKRR